MRAYCSHKYDWVFGMAQRAPSGQVVGGGSCGSGNTYAIRLDSSEVFVIAEDLNRRHCYIVVSLTSVKMIEEQLPTWIWSSIDDNVVQDLKGLKWLVCPMVAMFLAHELFHEVSFPTVFSLL